MVEIDGPILSHAMKIYAQYGFRDFVLCLGHRRNVIKEYFLNYRRIGLLESWLTCRLIESGAELICLVREWASSTWRMVPRLTCCGRRNSTTGRRGAAFNLSNELQITVPDLVRQVLRSTGSDLGPDVRNETSSEIRRQYLNAAQVRREFLA